MPIQPELLLPLLPLDDRVVLPHMTVPVAVDSEGARAAVLAARQTDGLVVLVPRIDGQLRPRGHRRAHRRVRPTARTDARRLSSAASTAPC